LFGLVRQEERSNVLTALDNLQVAQVQQPERFREALSLDLSPLSDIEGEAIYYVDPISAADMARSGPVRFINVVRNFQQSEIGKKANSVNTAVIELVARVFDFIFQDKSLADIIKLLLSRLQIPMLRAALLDVSFFEKNDHPARQLVNILASAALGWQEADGQQSPLFVLIENTVNRVVCEFKEDLSLFQTLYEEVSASLKQLEAQLEQQATEQAEQAQQLATETENQELADRAARQVIEQRLSERLTSPFVSNFLRQVWVKYVCHLLLTAQDDMAQLSSAVSTADDLLWSVEPKRDRLQRVRMLVKAPTIENQIRIGIAQIQWPIEHSDAFFRDLDDRWAGAVIGEPIVITEVTPPTDTEIDFVEAALIEEDDEAMQLVMRLEAGSMLELMKDDGALFCYKLGWVSEAKTRFLLTNRLNSAPLIVTAKYLAQRYRLGKMRLMEHEPLMDRALGSLLDALQETRYSEEMSHQTGAY
jgi:hypothetical protein